MFKKGSLCALILSAVVLSLVLAGCSKPPTEEMKKTEQALEEAKQKGAVSYAEDAFKKAEESLKKAKDQVTAKEYKEAVKTLAEATTLAQDATKAIDAGKAKMKEEAAKTVTEVQTALDDLKKGVADAIKKKLPVQKEEVQSAIGKWEIDFTGLKDKLEKGEIREAFDGLKSIAEGVKAKAEEITKLAPEPAKK
jgi:uncharacterized lipoprotein YehR (DUF1307 family)